jgi:DNA replication ATP-dependent helicase Dna2
VGVIVPYRNQIAMIREELSHKNIPRKNLISIDTVERYQGSQRDVIIYSFTISSIGQLNFLTANTFREGDFMIDRKLNVAITRARKQLILVGNPHILGADLTFYKLMEYIRMNNGYIDTTADEFAREKFSVPQYAANWDAKPQCYQLPEAFSALFRQYIANETEKRFPTVTINNAPLRETIGYGRYDFGNTGNSSLFSATDKLYLYNYFYMRRS